MKRLIIFIVMIMCLTSILGCKNKNENTDNNTNNVVERYSYTDGVHEFKVNDVENKYIVKDGTTDFVVVKPSITDSTLTLAVNELTTFFYRATNINLQTYQDSSDAQELKNDNAYRISVGETSLLKELGSDYLKENNFTKDTLGLDGARLFTKDNTIYLVGGSNFGTLYAVYDFLQICFNYEYYSRDCIVYDKDVKELPFKNLDCVDIPDIPFRSHGNSISYPNNKLIWANEAESGYIEQYDISNITYRYRYQTTVRTFIPIYEQYGGTTFNYGYHNSNYYAGPTIKDKNGELNFRSNWMSSAGNELCYTAHGNKEDLDALIETCADKLIYSLSMEKYMDRKNVGFTVVDGGYQCHCEACEEAYKNDGNSYCGAIVRCANRIMEIARKWMDENGQKDRELMMFFFAYGPTESAPVVFDEAQNKYVPANDSVICRDDVACFLCTHNDTRSIYFAEGENEEDIKELYKWSAVSKHMFNWFYQQRYHLYSAYFDTISMLNSDFYQFVKLNNSEFAFNQGHYVGDNMQSYGALNEYIYSKLMWDVTSDVEELTKNFFKNMYKDAWNTMYEAFTMEREHSMTVACDIAVGEYNYSNVRDPKNYPYRSYLLPLIEKYEKALSEIEYLKETDYGEYLLVKERINAELVSPLYLSLHFYGTSSESPFNNETKFKYVNKLIEICSNVDYYTAENGSSILTYVKGF